MEKAGVTFSDFCFVLGSSSVWVGSPGDIRFPSHSVSHPKF